MKLLHAISKSKIERYCLAEIGGPGLWAVRQSLCAYWSCAKIRV